MPPHPQNSVCTSVSLRPFAPDCVTGAAGARGAGGATDGAATGSSATQGGCGASELDPQGLVGPLEAEVRPFDLALGFAVLPEDQPLDVVRPQILAQALECPRRVLDDALAVLFEVVVGEAEGDIPLRISPERSELPKAGASGVRG